MQHGVFFITGKLGAGKGLVSVSHMVEKYIQRGRRVATNFNLFFEHYPNPHRRELHVIRLPDKPTAEHLSAIGTAYAGDYDESQNGLILLDECASWFNSRQWNDKGRQALIEWLIHARKLGWDLYFNVQSFEVVDSQARQLIGEHVVNCYAGKKLPIIRLLPFKFHLGTVYYMLDGGKQKVDTWLYKADRYYKLYDTRQIFSPFYAHGIYSYLSPWHLKGRYLKRRTWKDVVNFGLRLLLYAILLIFAICQRKPVMTLAYEYGMTCQRPG